MSKLDKLIKEYCPDGVEYRKLEDCCIILDKKRKPVTKAARETGKYPYYGANGIQDYVSNYIFDGTFVLVGEDGSVITKAGTPVVTWAEGKIWVNNHAHIIEEGNDVLLRYLFHYIQTIDVTSLIHGNIPKLTGGDFKALKVAVPPLEVQREIVRILDSFTLLTAELTAELTARKKQYEFYRNKLLTFDNNVKIVPLADIADIGTGSSNTNEGLEEGKYPFYVRSQEPLRKNEYEYDETAIITAGDGVGVERFENSESGEYFAVFMDMQMPVMDGIEATRQIRGSEREDSNIPIFAMTANTFAVDKKRCQDAGMDGYIPKPINLKEIQNTLNETIES